MSHATDMIRDEYFEWLFDLACSRHVSYRKLLLRLHDIEFRYSITRDQNRAEDGIDLRYDFATNRHYGMSHLAIMGILDGPCSVLEMMLGLAIRCENTMDDPKIGDRTRQWLWEMIVNLGLGAMYDSNYDESVVDRAIERFLDREYEPNGKGGLFTIMDCEHDLRDVEIWRQMCWYLDSISDI